jgi:hypothetical protein
MNERIRELADQAGFMEAWFSESGDDCEREIKKFAELIVKECAGVAEVSMPINSHPDDRLIVKNSVLKHFGVAE